LKLQIGDFMTYERFEDLPVWKTAIDFAEKIYALTEKERRLAQDKKKREEFMATLKNYQKTKD